MSEQSLENEIKEYKKQITQIDSVINSADAQNQNPELKSLKNDLEQLLKLTEESLLELKKQNLLESLRLFEENESNEIEKQAESKINLSDSESVSNKRVSDINDIVATKSRIYYECKNSNIKYHNVVVLGVDSFEENTVRVLFCNPTETKLKICEHFMNDTCRFDENCKFSHGYKVNLDDLLPYLEPSYKNIKIGMDCLAKHTDELWHLAKVESIDEHKICVQFKKFNLTTALDWESVLLIENNDQDDETSSDSDSEFEESCTIGYDNEENTPNTSKSFNHSLVNFGEWEKHTRGIGSKLMAKMGYKYGQGLGKIGKEGRLEPVEAFALPEGNISLDKVMELKEREKLKKLKKNFKIKKNYNKNNYEQIEEPKEEVNVFDFINTTLSKKKETTLDEPIKSKNDKAQIPNKGLNIKMLETHNQIQNAEKNLNKLRESLIRNRNSDKATIDQIKIKLELSEKNLSKLRQTELDISNENTKRKRKSEIF